MVSVCPAVTLSPNTGKTTSCALTPDLRLRMRPRVPGIEDQRLYGRFSMRSAPVLVRSAMGAPCRLVAPVSLPCGSIARDLTYCNGDIL